MKEIKCKQCGGKGTVPFNFYTAFATRNDKIEYTISNHKGKGITVACPVCWGNGNLDWITNILGIRRPIKWVVTIHEESVDEVLDYERGTCDV